MIYKFDSKIQFQRLVPPFTQVVFKAHRDAKRFKVRQNFNLWKSIKSLNYLKFMLFALTWFFLGSELHAQNITVADSAGLIAELAKAQGGETFYLVSGPEPYDLNIQNTKVFTAPIKIMPANRLVPTQIKSLVLENANNLIFDGFIFVSDLTTNNGVANTDVFIAHSTSIVISNNTMLGTAKRYLTAVAAKEIARNLMFIRWSDNVKIEGNKIMGYFQGIAALETTHLAIIGNEISGIQGDGIRMGGIGNLTISRNYIHDFYSSDQTLNHSDMIQLWATNAIIISHDIEISDNILLSGSGAATQTIFLRNEQADQTPNSDTQFYSNISIKNNLIQNGHVHGISVGETNNVEVSNNTLLYDPQSHFGDPNASYIPPANIRVLLPGITVAKRSRQVVIRNNVAAAIVVAPADAVIAENYLLNYINPRVSEANENLYYGTAGGGALPLAAFLVIPGSAVAPITLGSSLTHHSIRPRESAFVYRAKKSTIIANQYEFEVLSPYDNLRLKTSIGTKTIWNFGDGTGASELLVTHTFNAPGLYRVNLSISQPNERTFDYWSFISVPK